MGRRDREENNSLSLPLSIFPAREREGEKRGIARRKKLPRRGQRGWYL